MTPTGGEVRILRQEPNSTCRFSSMVEQLLPNQKTWVRFLQPSPKFCERLRCAASHLVMGKMGGPVPIGTQIKFVRTTCRCIPVESPGPAATIEVRFSQSMPKTDSVTTSDEYSCNCTIQVPGEWDRGGKHSLAAPNRRHRKVINTSWKRRRSKRGI